ncbi:MAG: hypothetical protein LAT64_10115 [Phycisphaerales bacterium]|nr:hypothetical protein [Planctomycetota bacterium]MCH8509105.1 hypothetical protein [Phycisphaerales bacterium]
MATFQELAHHYARWLSLAMRQDGIAPASYITEARIKKSETIQAFRDVADDIDQLVLEDGTPLSATDKIDLYKLISEQFGTADLLATKRAASAARNDDFIKLIDEIIVIIRG